ncbi:GNAT family N-acetyltransferase [Acidobacteria bacterium AB60]|nr:GNAT family N-acetyltransferase [Acidobacteria bacterium AB60]
MLLTRPAVLQDVPLIASHRQAMFLAMGIPEPPLLQMRRNFEPWLKRMMERERYLGWIITDENAPVASTGLLLLDWPPHPFDPVGELRGYLLNVFVEAAYRRRGLARQLVETAMQECRRRGIRTISLHASDAGRPLYTQLGFESNNEMLFREAP